MDLNRVNDGGLVLLGCGKMGSALLEGWLANGVRADSVHVIEPHPSDWLKATGVHLNAPLPPSPVVAVLAVKPQMMGAALPSLKALAGGRTVFLSIAAGTSLASIESALGAGTAVVRAMPNTPAAVGRGITALIGNTAVDAGGLALATDLMAAVGDTVHLDSEDQMDAVTGVSGSGPAYVFHMIEALTEAGVAQGLPEALAQKLARATVTGAGELARQSSESAAQLRINVTSPGGTTAAALAVLMPQLPDLMTKAVTAATDRSRELGK
ncbi:MAG: pyrroline-5-carboxylate reductase [Paracoccaceae bacterium]